MSYAHDMERVLVAATELSGSQQRAIEWFFSEHLREFDGKTADALVRDGKVQLVLDYIESIASGFVG